MQPGPVPAVGEQGAAASSAPRDAQPQQPAAFDHTFTVFTPAYNRAHTLHRVYESLKAQTFRDFEWLIVDDGSTDDVPALVEQWQHEAAFAVRYIRQEHQGKHFAFNRGVREARGEFFLPLDSDDACVPQTLARLKAHWDAIPADQRERFAGVGCLCADQHGRLVGDRYPQDVFDSSVLEMRYRAKVAGEKWWFHRTEILRRHPLPEVLPRQYVPEGLVWHAIARTHQVRFVNEPLRIYYIDEPSLVHGQPAGKNAGGGELQHRTALNEEIDFFRHAPREFFRSAVHYTRFGLHAGTSLPDQFRRLTNPLARCLWLAMLPVGLLVWLRDRNRYWQILRQQPRPGWFLISRLLMRTGVCRRFLIRRQDHRLWFHPASLSAALWIDPADRQTEAEVIRACLRPGDTLIDVGANVGTTTLPAAFRVQPVGRVIAIEPHPVICGYLRENIELNGLGNVTVHNVALGERSETGRLSDLRADDQNAIVAEGTDSGGGKAISVPTVPLDEIAPPDGPIRLLKIDVEGYEAAVLRGAGQTLRRTECVLFECCSEFLARYGCTSRDVLALLVDHGFTLFRFITADTVAPVGADYRVRRLEDLLAVRQPDAFFAECGLRLTSRRQVRLAEPEHG